MKIKKITWTLEPTNNSEMVWCGMIGDKLIACLCRTDEHKWFARFLLDCQLRNTRETVLPQKDTKKDAQRTVADYLEEVVEYHMKNLEREFKKTRDQFYT